MYLQADNDNYKYQQYIITLHYTSVSVLRLTLFYQQQHNCFCFFSLCLSISHVQTLVDINRSVRILQFMHTVFGVWVPEAILFFNLSIYFGYQ